MLYASRSSASIKGGQQVSGPGSRIRSARRRTRHRPQQYKPRI